VPSHFDEWCEALAAAQWFSIEFEADDAEAGRHFAVLLTGFEQRGGDAHTVRAVVKEKTEEGWLARSLYFPARDVSGALVAVRASLSARAESVDGTLTVKAGKCALKGPALRKRTQESLREWLAG